MILIVGVYEYGTGFYKPGPLSAPHSQILAGKMGGASCAACHPQATTSLFGWFLTGHDAAALSQSDACMDCHHNELRQETARNAHNLTAEQLSGMNHGVNQTRPVSWNEWMLRPAFALDDVACATCHQEHGGADARLTSLSDAQCQTCHSDRFTSFATDHPAWDQWPYSKTESIAFDHGTHAKRHFTASKDESGNAKPFRCLDCHEKKVNGEFSRVTGYQACADCHDKSLNQQVGERLDLFTLPSLIQPRRERVGDWPAAATGFYDGKVGPLARWLLNSDPTIRQAIATLPAEGDYSRMDLNNASQRDAAETVAIAIANFIDSMGSKGPIVAATEFSGENQAMNRILKGLSPQLLSESSYRWHRKVIDVGMVGPKQDWVRPTIRAAAVRTKDNDDELLLDEDDPDGLLQEDGNSQEDPLLPSPLTPNGTLPGDSQGELGDATALGMKPNLDFDPVTMLPHGGWFANDTRMSISYRGYGHADPVLQAAIELVAGLPESDSIRRELLGSNPAAACMVCHPGATRVGAATWKVTPSSHRPRGAFTKFSHSPHMTLPVLSDCVQCHSLEDRDAAPPSTGLVTSVGNANGLSGAHHDFAPLQKMICSACHTAMSAGDECVKCHRYHPSQEPFSHDVLDGAAK